MNASIEKIIQLAKSHDIYIILGTIRKFGDKYYNSMLVINPNGETIETYDKRALWGWDTKNFIKGSDLGIYQIDDIKIGLRICFEIRFPEYFREMYKSGVKLCLVCFCDISEKDLPERYEIIKSHLRTRAVENVMTVISVNSISHFQTAPTAVFDCNGGVVMEAPKNKKHLLIYDYFEPEMSFGMKGRIANTDMLLY